MSRYAEGRPGGARPDAGPEGLCGDEAWSRSQPPPGPAPTLQVRARVPHRGLDVDESFAGPGVSALVGPNGAGKSTLLAVVAGLLRAPGAEVVVGERVLQDGVTWIPAHRRGVTLLGQDPLVFPHLDVRTNVAFGPRARGLSRRAADAVAAKWLERVGAADLARQRGDRLSGGQAQRVALARALAAEPAVLLLDEPLSALDVDVAAQMRQVLRAVLHDSGVRALLVTHDPLDVAGLAHDVTVLEGGRVAERGTVAEVLGAPRSGFGARLAGRTLVRGRAVGPDAIELADGTRVHGRGPVPVGAAAVALWDPADVAVHVGTVTGSPRTVIPARVADLAARSGAVRLTADTASGIRLAADVTPLAVAELGLRPGVPVSLAVKAQNVRLLPAPGDG